MCGIAGYSLSSRSRVDRTLAAQSLLAGIAERGADAVGYAHRSPGESYPAVTKQRTPASMLLERIDVPETATELLVHVRDYTKGHPSIAANNHPVRHGPIVGIHNGIIVNDDELLAPLSCARAEPRMTVDSEAIFALAAHSRNDPRALEALVGSMAAAWLDEREPGSVFAARGMGRAALGRRRPARALLRVDEARARRRRALRRDPAPHARAAGRHVRRPARRPGGAARALPPRPELRRERPPSPGPRPAGRRVLPRPARGSHRGVSRPSDATRVPCSSRRSRTRNWKVDQAPRRASSMR